MKPPGQLNTGAESVNRCTHDKCFNDDADGGHRPTDQDEENRHIHTRVRDVCTQSRRHVGEEGGETGDVESKSVCIEQQGKTHMITAEELKKMIAEGEAYFMHNGRVLKIGEVARDSRHTLVFHFRGCARNSPHSPMAAPQQRSSPDARSRMDRFFQRFNSGHARQKHYPAGDNSEASAT